MTLTLEQNQMKAQHGHVDDGWHSVPATTFSALLASVASDDLAKTDRRLTRKDLRLDTELRLDGMPLTAHALRQFATAAKTPAGILGLREIGQAKWLSEVLNEQVAASGFGNAPCVVRLRKSETGENVVRAVFGKRPVFFDAINALETLADAVGDQIAGAVLPRVQTDRDSYAIKMFLPDSVAAVVDTKYGRGLAVSVSEVGGGTSLAAFTFDYTCLNGMISMREKLQIKPTGCHGAVDYAETCRNIRRAMDVLASAADDLLTQMGYYSTSPSKSQRSSSPTW